MYPTISCPIFAELKKCTGFRTQNTMLDPGDSKMNGTKLCPQLFLILPFILP